MVKILIIDDESAFTETYMQFLRRIENVETYGALNSKEAFAALKEQKPDLMLLDLNLNEKVKGLDILKFALGINPNIYTILITGNGETKTENECYAAGVRVQKILEKPIALQYLHDAVVEAVNIINSKR